jgi:hypothetical protein
MVGELFNVDSGDAVAKAAAAGWKDATEWGVKVRAVRRQDLRGKRKLAAAAVLVGRSRAPLRHGRRVQARRANAIAAAA